MVDGTAVFVQPQPMINRCKENSLPLCAVIAAALFLSGCATGYEEAFAADTVNCADGSMQSLSSPPPYCVNRGGLAGTSMSPERIAAIQQQKAMQSQALDSALTGLNQVSAGILATAAAQSEATRQMAVPQVVPLGQPNSTAIVYCRDLTDNLVACRQVR